MATTKRKRRPTKHRGNAAGMIESRGRTGRKPSPEEQRKDLKAAARDRRLNAVPSWRSAVNKAAIAAVVFAVAITLLFKRPIGAAVVLAAFTFAIYVPLSYYTDLLIFRRAQAKRGKS